MAHIYINKSHITRVFRILYIIKDGELAWVSKV